MEEDDGWVFDCRLESGESRPDHTNSLQQNELCLEFLSESTSSCVTFIHYLPICLCFYSLARHFSMVSSEFLSLLRNVTENVPESNSQSHCNKFQITVSAKKGFYWVTRSSKELRWNNRRPLTAEMRWFYATEPCSMNNLSRLGI